jgi:hypothetical protein
MADQNSGILFFDLERYGASSIVCNLGENFSYLEFAIIAVMVATGSEVLDCCNSSRDRPDVFVFDVVPQRFECLNDNFEQSQFVLGVTVILLR